MLNAATPPVSPTLTPAQAELVKKGRDLAGSGTAPTIDALALATGTDRANVAKMRRRIKAAGGWPWADFPRGRASPNAKAKPKLNAEPKRPRVRAPRAKSPESNGAAARVRAKRPRGLKRPKVTRVFGVKVSSFYVESLDEYRRTAGHLIHGPSYRA